MGVRDPDNTTCCTLIKGEGEAIPVQAYYRPCGFQEVQAPFLDSWHMKVVRLSALRTGCLVLIFLGSTLTPEPKCGWRDEKSQDPVGNRTFDLLAGSTVPQSTVLPYAPLYSDTNHK